VVTGTAVGAAPGGQGSALVATVAASGASLSAKRRPEAALDSSGFSIIKSPCCLAEAAPAGYDVPNGAPSLSATWKAPLPEFIEELYFQRFKKSRPENVRSIEQMQKRLRHQVSRMGEPSS
jgi:hypothetical protein